MLWKNRRGQIESSVTDYVQVQVNTSRAEYYLQTSPFCGSVGFGKSGKASWLKWNIESFLRDGLEECRSVGRGGAFHAYPFAVRGIIQQLGKKENVSGFLETAPTHCSFSEGSAGCGQFCLTPARGLTSK